MSLIDWLSEITFYNILCRQCFNCCVDILETKLLCEGFGICFVYFKSGLLLLILLFLALLILKFKLSVHILNLINHFLKSTWFRYWLIWIIASSLFTIIKSFLFCVRSICIIFRRRLQTLKVWCMMNWISWG